MSPGNKNVPPPVFSGCRPARVRSRRPVARTTRVPRRVRPLASFQLGPFYAQDVPTRTKKGQPYFSDVIGTKAHVWRMRTARVTIWKERPRTRRIYSRGDKAPAVSSCLARTRALSSSSSSSSSSLPRFNGPASISSERASPF